MSSLVQSNALAAFARTRKIFAFSRNINHCAGYRKSTATTTTFIANKSSLSGEKQAVENENDNSDSDTDNKRTRRMAKRDIAATKADGRFRETARDKAKSQALRFLASKPRTRKELEQKLVEDCAYEVEDARDALDDIKKLGLHDDAKYAEQWARMKWRTSRWAKWRCKMELVKRGVSENDCEDGLWAVYADFERSFREHLVNVCRDYEDSYSSDSNSSVSTTNALRFDVEDVLGVDEDDSYAVGEKRAKELFASARKQWMSGKSSRYLNDDSEANTRRLFAWLQRRGFDLNVSRMIADTLKDEEQKEKWRLEK